MIERARYSGIAAIVLAAGGARRMGRTKQLLLIDGQPMVRRVAEAVCGAGLAQVVVVVGSQAEAVGQALRGLPVDVIENRAWDAGMSASLRAGLMALRPDIEAALVVLADQPGLTAGLIRALAGHYRATGADIVAPFYQGRRGHPILFARALFPELLAVEGDEGGRQVLARHHASITGIEVDDTASLADIDTDEDYRALQMNREQKVNPEAQLRGLTHLIIDMDGVLYRGREAIPGTSEFLTFLRQRQIGFILATNNSTRTPEQYVEKLAGMGVAVCADEIMTSSQATAEYLAGIAPHGARVFCIGMDGLVTALREAGFTLVEDAPDFVVAGMDFTVCMERLAQATLHIRAGARFIGTNADRTFPSERGIVPGAGSLLALLEAATGVTPIVIGKPETAMVERAMAHLGAERGSTGILGDRLETDILAGQRAGLFTILVMSGVTDSKLLAASEIRPHVVFRDVAELHAAWKELLGDGSHPFV